MAIETLFPEWKMWTQFLQHTASGLVIDALEESHPIEVSKRLSWLSSSVTFKRLILSGLIE